MRGGLAVRFALILSPLVIWLALLAVFGSICALQRSGLARTLPCSPRDQWAQLRRRNVADYQVDARLRRGVVPSIALEEYASLGGQLAAKGLNLLLIGLVHDAEASLPSLLGDIEELLGAAPGARLVACESGSGDRSREVLDEWRLGLEAEAGERVSIPTAEEWAGPEVQQTEVAAGGADGLLGTREQRLAGLRMDCIRAATRLEGTLAGFDLVAMLDMDVLRIDVRGVLDSVGAIELLDRQGQRWSAVCSFGKFAHGIYRDTYAHRTRALDTSEHFLVEAGGSGGSIWRRDKFLNLKVREQVQRDMASIARGHTKSHGMVLVDSCFGGLALYSPQVLEACEYAGVSWNDKEGRLMPDCEHVSLNSCASGTYSVKSDANASTGFDVHLADVTCNECKSALINPRMQVWQGKNAWTGVLGPELFYPILLLGGVMTLLDLPLLLLGFSLDSSFILCWIKLYLIVGWLYLTVKAYRLLRKRRHARSHKVKRAK